VGFRTKAELKAEQQEVKAELRATNKSVGEMKNNFTVSRLLFAVGSALFGACATLWSVRKQLGWG
jgi:hypothetical protein